MIKREETPIVIKSKALALEIIKLCNFLKEKKHEYSLSDQMIRSGTSVGANIREAIHGVSDNDMYNKFNILPSLRSALCALRLGQVCLMKTPERSE